MAEYIEREALKRAIRKVFHDLGMRIDINSVINIQPTADVVEVVRCCDADKGDCMFNHWHETPNGEKYHICNLNQLSFSEHADFYCAYGERREDERLNKQTGGD